MSTRQRPPEATSPSRRDAWTAVFIGPEDLARVHAALAAGARVDDVDADHRTPLHRAADHGHARTCQILLDHGADLEARDGGQWTALHRGAFGRNSPLATTQVLLAAGAQVDALDRWGRTPLHLADMETNSDTCTLLLQHGADPLAKATNGTLADPFLAHTMAVIDHPTTSPATRHQLRIHAVCHLGDQPATAARLLLLLRATADVGQVA